MLIKSLICTAAWLTASIVSMYMLSITLLEDVHGMRFPIFSFSPLEERETVNFLVLSVCVYLLETSICLNPKGIISALGAGDQCATSWLTIPLPIALSSSIVPFSS